MSSELGNEPHAALRRRGKRLVWDCCARRRKALPTAHVSDFLPKQSPAAELPADASPTVEVRKRQVTGLDKSHPCGATRRSHTAAALRVSRGKVAMRGGRGAFSNWSGSFHSGGSSGTFRTFTKLKRSIFELRRGVFDSLARAQQQKADEGANEVVADTAGAARSGGGSSVLPSSSAGGVVNPAATKLRRLQKDLNKLHVTYNEMYNAIQQKNYLAAVRYRAAFCRMRRRLKWDLLNWRDDALNTAVCNDEEPNLGGRSTQQEIIPEKAAHVCLPDEPKEVRDVSASFGTASCEKKVCINFYPSLAQLGVGRHPLAALIDQRSGRHPQRLSSDCVARLLKISQEPTLPSGETWLKEGKCARYVAPCCANIITDELDDLVFTVLQRQYALQSRMKKEKPLQFKGRKFYSTGLREVLRSLRAAATRVPAVLIASDIELDCPTTRHGGDATAKSHEHGGVSDAQDTFVLTHKSVQELGVVGTLEEIRHHCAVAGISLITCMSRRRLAYALYAKGCNISVVLLHSAEGVHEEVRALRHYGRQLCDLYQRVSTTA
uniref:Uncharacterized protein TCIL3000_10_13880 n=1 Tax=Trypanosoma congolense (strain IL3000) TaxID=1068625 RepID=G0UYY5_TRYCI|nr:unnamed protein product [Trypanosoma congolense IL3000]